MAYQLQGGSLVQRGRLAPGQRGTAQTLAIMRRLATQGAGSNDVRKAAQRILRDAAVPAHDFLGELRAIHTWVADRIRYLRDPVGVELLQSPQRTLRDGMGDCDDKATLLAGLLRSIGHPAQLAFRVIGTNPVSGQFGHVYVVAKMGGRRIPLDPTRAGTPPGWEYQTPVIAGEVPL